MFQHFYCVKVLVLRFNFHMEHQYLLKEKSSEEEKADLSIMEESISSFAKEKTGRKGKKDNLKEKKKLKSLERQLAILNEQDNDHRSVKNKSDEDNSATTHEVLPAKAKTNIKSVTSKSSFNLTKLITKPPYVSLSNPNRISGDFGHSTAIFKRPIIEGTYFLELIVKQDSKKDKKLNYKPSVRVGICPYGYNCSFPLGCEESIAYKSSDGKIIKNGQQIGEGEPFYSNDVIGILMKISPPHKHPNPKETNAGSSVSFFKNGKLILEFKELKQIFYCFGVSFFNYGQVEILTGPHYRYQMAGEDAKHYFAILNETILYKDLQNDKMFKI